MALPRFQAFLCLMRRNSIQHGKRMSGRNIKVAISWSMHNKTSVSGAALMCLVKRFSQIERLPQPCSSGS